MGVVTTLTLHISWGPRRLSMTWIVRILFSLLGTDLVLRLDFLVISFWLTYEGRGIEETFFLGRIFLPNPFEVGPS